MSRTAGAELDSSFGPNCLREGFRPWREWPHFARLLVASLLMTLIVYAIPPLREEILFAYNLPGASPVLMIVFHVAFLSGALFAFPIAVHSSSFSS